MNESEPEWLTRAREEGRVLSERFMGRLHQPEEASGNVSRSPGEKPPKSRRKRASMREAEFQEQVIELAQRLGWRCAHFRKVRVQRVGGDTYWETPVAADGKGWPDLVLARIADERMLAAELKVPPNTATPEQLMWLACFKAAGIGAFVWTPDDWDVIEKTLDT